MSFNSKKIENGYYKLTLNIYDYSGDLPLVINNLNDVICTNHETYNGEHITIYESADIIGEAIMGEMYDVITGEFISHEYTRGLSYKEYEKITLNETANSLRKMKSADVLKYKEKITELKNLAIDNYDLREQAKKAKEEQIKTDKEFIKNFKSIYRK